MRDLDFTIQFKVNLHQMFSKEKLKKRELSNFWLWIIIIII